MPDVNLLPNIHLLYVMDQEDPQYGLLNLKNEELMTQLMNTVKDQLGYDMTTTYLTRNYFTSVALKETIVDLKTGPQDIVVLYYSGFGLPPAGPGNKFANWKLRDMAIQGLSVDVVEAWLVAKQVHLSLIIADNSVQQMDKSAAPNSRARIGRVDDLRKKVISRLFQDTHGVVKMGSSLPSAHSWANSKSCESVFTSAYHKAFNSLLRTSDLAELPQITFDYLHQSMERHMASGLEGLPHKQVPVLELKPKV